MSNFVPSRFGYSTLTLTMCAPSFSVTAHTNRNVATNGYKRGIVLKSTAGDKPGTLRLCRTYSTHGRSHKPNGRPCGATNRRVDIECEGRMGRGFSPGRAPDPKQRMLWRNPPTGRTLSRHRSYESLLNAIGPRGFPGNQRWSECHIPALELRDNNI